MLGISTNYRLIKEEVEDSEDPIKVINGYLSLKNVARFVQRHKSEQQYNPFRTIGRAGDRVRYSHRTRRESKIHPPPSVMHQYEWKPWKEQPEYPESSKTTPQQSLRTKLTRGYPQRDENLRGMGQEHPTVTLNLRSLQNSVGAALQDDPHLAQIVIDCLRQAVRDANKVKRQFQEIVGRFIESLATSTLTISDREFLDHLCIRTKKPTGSSDEPEDIVSSLAQDDTEAPKAANTTESSQICFIGSIARFLYTGNEPHAPLAKRFWNRLKTMGILATNIPPTLSCMQRNGKIDPDISIEINEDISYIENFIALNRISGNSWKIIPISPMEDGFVSFTEYEFGTFFCNHPDLYYLMDAMSKDAFPNDSSWYLTPSGLVLDWMPRADFGILIKRFIAPIGIDTTDLSVRKRGKLGYRGAIKLLSHQEIRNHINTLRSKSFDPRKYSTKGYVLRGSIRTDGHRLQLLGFKLKELLSVKFKRYKKSILPDRQVSVTHLPHRG
ncbi:hypothetical protein BGW38_000703 [Lunasporangiospora selenospora]|uniref:Uncharacterized protein n=1 Tax=Lunasporangiospora selenospora TaxID=979761 RepID=A0A9P6FUR5_9FUNG|nr:hypothetical protein BGW38_000703 [Lunasporangiospora selenospora]